MPAANVARPPGTPRAGRHGIFKTMITTWTRANWLQAGLLLGFIALMHAGASTANQILGIIGTGVGGSFLYIIAILNLVALIGIVRVFRAMRGGELDEARLETHLLNRGFMNRILGRLTRTITRPGQMYPVGILFGLGFDTATEDALLVLAGTGAASGLPWYGMRFFVPR
jgi:nickel/cobalt transporter (NiCoT) family protein